ncbi:MAG: hypothetical protein JWQ18_1672 [Conexibacter sp.]|nr:hypothetical protein [Conexibacter sp.]
MFDLVHARFQLCTLGRGAEQLAAYRRLLKPGGVLILEEPDTRSWTYAPHAPATTHLIGRLAQAYAAAGGNLDAGRRIPALLREATRELDAPGRGGTTLTLVQAWARMPSR